jgi:hypothetical protein
MRNVLWLSQAVLLIAALWAPALAIAQVPPHAPGTICATPQFWCPAVYPGPPGTRCACRTAGGWVQGVLI